MHATAVLAAALVAPAAAQPTDGMVPRAPVPDAARIAELGRVIDALLDDPRPGESARERADWLLQRADRLVDVPVARYTLLSKVRDLCFVSDLPVRARETALRIAFHFDVDGPAVRRETMRMSAAMIRSDRTAVAWTVCWLEDASYALAGDYYDLARDRHDHAREIVEEIAGFDVFPSRRAAAMIAAARADFDAIGRRRERLRSMADADGPEAATERGLYAACYLGDWTTGFDILRHGSDRALAKLADAERRFPSLTADQRVRILDGWLRVADAQTDEIARRNLRWRVLWGLDAAVDELETKSRAQVVARMLELTRFLLPASGPGVITFDDPADLDHLVLHGGDEWTVRDGQLHATSRDDHATASYDLAFLPLRAVRIRGRITGDNNHNFRFTVGPVSAILNWELADENHFRNLDTGEKVVTRGHLLQPNTEHEIFVATIGQDVVVFCDGREVFTTRATLHGAVSVYPAFGSIAVQDITILGDIDPGAVVTGPRR